MMHIYEPYFTSLNRTIYIRYCSYMKVFSFKKIVLLVLAVLLIGSLNLYSEKARTFFYNISYPFQQILWSSGDAFSDFLAGLFHTTQLKQENDMLREENLALLQNVVQLEDTARENAELRKALKAEFPSEFDVVLAGIVGREIGKDVLIIDKGKESGIEKSMPVITPGRLVVGRIDSVFEGFSRVLLISQENVSFDAEVMGKNIIGAVRGQGAGRLVFDLIPQKEDLQEGDMVITSNLARIFPENLLVGIVEKVVKEDVEPFQKADVRWFFDISSMENVLVITNVKVFGE